jgi:hypothetical protein
LQCRRRQPAGGPARAGVRDRHFAAPARARPPGHGLPALVSPGSTPDATIPWPGLRRWSSFKGQRGQRSAPASADRWTC